jgi:hypothetical protein
MTLAVVVVKDRGGPQERHASVAGLIEQFPTQTAHPKKECSKGFLIQGRRFFNAAKEVDLGS